MKRVHIVGHKNSGKTTLIVDLVKELTRRGYRVGTIKHTHHHHELDTPGKDSHRHREAGSAAVGIISPGMSAIFWPRTPENSKADAYEQFDGLMSTCDVVLVEGDSQAQAPKIEVFRASLGSPPKASSDASIRAIVTDDALEVPVEIWKRSELTGVVAPLERLLQLAPDPES